MGGPGSIYDTEKLIHNNLDWILGYTSLKTWGRVYGLNLRPRPQLYSKKAQNLVVHISIYSVEYYRNI